MALTSRIFLLLVALGVVLTGQPRPITLHTGTMLDGKGGQRKNVTVVVRDGKIASIEGGFQGTPDYDLREATLMPGWIDTHSHIGWHFNKEGRAETSNESPAEFMTAGAANVYETLQAGFTTVQSLGADTDIPLRDAINRGVIPGPRLLTSGSPFNERSGTPDAIRKGVREHVAAGVDLVKLFSTKSIRDGGGQTMTDEQIQAGCGEAKLLG
ncbi:MAG: amidohydrolase family protein [Bryobacteraceae bacterium]|nr:amidohydrolase family protein [Bryobacteraceae bacterium]